MQNFSTLTTLLWFSQVRVKPSGLCGLRESRAGSGWSALPRARRLGHADPSVTLRVYAHVIRDQVAEAADISLRSIPAGDGAATNDARSDAGGDLNAVAVNGTIEAENYDPRTHRSAWPCEPF